MKTCTKCKEEKPFEAFAGTQKGDGTKIYSTQCKTCVNTHRKEQRRAQGRPSRAEWLVSVRKPKLSPDEKQALGKSKWAKWMEQNGERMRLELLEKAEQDRQAVLESGVKCCPTCEQEKPLHRFHTRNRKRKDGSSYKSTYSSCKDCRRVANREYEHTPKAKVSKRKRAALCSRRSREATPKWLTPEQKQAIADIYDHMRDCRAVTGEDYHVDHIIPLRGENVCGLHVPWNLQVLPAYVNISKSNIFMD